MTDPPKHVIQEIEKRIVDLLPQEIDIHGEMWDLKRDNFINERWRWNKYHKGHFFKPHFDVSYPRGVNEATQLTLVIYLNDGFDGGETVFYPGGKRRFDLVCVVFSLF